MTNKTFWCIVLICLTWFALELCRADWDAIRGYRVHDNSDLSLSDVRSENNMKMEEAEDFKLFQYLTDEGYEVREFEDDCKLFNCTQED